MKSLKFYFACEDFQKKSSEVLNLIEDRCTVTSIYLSKIDEEKPASMENLCQTVIFKHDLKLDELVVLILKLNCACQVAKLHERIHP